MAESQKSNVTDAQRERERRTLAMIITEVRAIRERIQLRLSRN